MTETLSPAFSPEAIERRNEPAWLVKRRREALEIYHKRQLPTPRIEAWKYTNLRKFKPEDFAMARATETATETATPSATPTSLAERQWLPLLRRP